MHALLRDPDPAAVAAPSRRRVMVVDDDADGAQSMALFLELEGHAVEALRCPLEALEAAPRFAPEVVVLDLGLPQLDGFELARRLRGHAATRDALFVAVSGYGRAEDRERSRAAGFDHHLVKPADPLALVALIAAWRPPRAA